MHLLQHQGPRKVDHYDEETGRCAGYSVDHADGRRDAVITAPLRTVTIHASDFGMNVTQLGELMHELAQRFPDKPPTQSGLLLPGGFL